MTKWFLVFLFVPSLVLAQDLEGLLSGETSSQSGSENVKNPDLLAETLRSQMKSRPTVDQNLFLNHLMSRRYEEALILMASAFGADPQSYSANLKAIRSYLLFQAGLKVTAVEELFAISDLEEVHYYILNRWKEVLPNYDDPVWVAAEFEWSPQFTKVFGTTLEARVGLARVQVRHDLSKLKDLTFKVLDQSPEKHLINWSLALAHLSLDQNQEAAKLISSLLKSNQNQVPQDSIHMTAARMLYQAGLFDGAITYYKKIPKKSDLWILAQEEMAWTYLRKGEPQNAVAIGITITNPMLKGWAGPESYLVTAIGSLRICDYPQVIRTLERFSTHFKPRVQFLNAIASGDLSHSSVQSLIRDIKNGPSQGLSLIQVGSRIHHVPTLMVTNRSIRDWLKADVAFEREIDQAEKLFSRSMALSGLQGQFQVLKNRILAKKDRNLKQVNNLIQNLARQEVEQIKQTLAKMHIIEAELLTHVSIADRLLSGNTVKDEKDIATKVGTTGSQDKFAVKYKMTDEIWFDEIGNYKVDVKKSCQQRKAQAQ